MPSHATPCQVMPLCATLCNFGLGHAASCRCMPVCRVHACSPPQLPPQSLRRSLVARATLSCPPSAQAAI
eukprot:350372-Chlamydomonas_euryale.AAC.12